MSRLLFILFILAMVCVKLCIGNHGETSEISARYTDDTNIRKSQNTLTDSTRYNNEISTGATPYRNSVIEGNNNSKIIITNNVSRQYDAVVIVKHGGKIVRNTYITAGDTTSIYVPNGTYHIYIYKGNKWNSAKEISKKYYGGFESKEHFYSYAPITLSYNTHRYDITEPGNKNICSADKIFGSSN